MKLRLMHGVALAAVIGLACGPAGAVPVTMKLQSGQDQNVEIVGYVDGNFIVRDKEGAERRVPAADVKAIRFRETARPPTDRPSNAISSPATTLGGARAPQPARPLTADEVQRLAEEHRFPMLYVRFQTTLVRGGADKLMQLAKDIRDRLDRPDVPPGTRRDLTLARVLIQTAMGEREAADAMLRQVHADYPNDPVVQQFDKERRRAMEFRAERKAFSDMTIPPKGPVSPRDTAPVAKEPLPTPTPTKPESKP